MNEATFESHLANTLLSLFPAPLATRFETQRVFSLRLGHKPFQVDGLRTLSRGRGDVILFLDEKPTLMLELKAPGIEPTDEDVQQGLSYARLHDPMIPIVVVTNGDSTLLYSTYDGSRIDCMSIDEQVLERLLQQGAKRATKTREDAIRDLIGGNPLAWAAALRAETERTLSDSEGGLEDLTKPLSADFRLARRATALLAGAFNIEKEKALALVGPPLSGKTNVIAELCRRSEEFNLAPLYVDCGEASDLLEEISRALTDSLGASIPRDQVYDWLRLGMGSEDDDRPRVVLILDSLFPSDSAELMKQATQLLSSAASNFSVLYSLTDGDWDRVRNVPGRMTLSKLGRHAKPVMLRELTDDEVEVACQNFRTGYRVLLPDPYQFELTMRQPHSLRLLMSMEGDAENLPEGMVRHLPPIIPTDFLTSLWKRTSQTPELRADYLSLAECYIKDAPSRHQNLHLATISMGVGAVSLEGAQAHLPPEVFGRLLGQGHIKRINLLSSVVIVPTVPELLSAACVHVALPMILEAPQRADARAAKDAMLQWTRGLALGDRVASAMLIDLATRDATLFFNIFELLMDDEPREEIKESGNFLMQVPGGEIVELVYNGETVRITLPDGTEQEIEWPDDEGPMRLMSDVHSWQILSHLSYAGIALNAEDGLVLLAPLIFRRVGKFRSTLRDVGRASFYHASSVYEHSLPGYGTVPCPAHGIVEPIAYGMQVNIQRFGSVMDELVKEAIEDGDPALLMRLYVATSTLDGIAEPETATRAKRMTEEIHAALDAVFQVISEDAD
jgi:Type I restriction enzyme R protein N terminus (HSDR_N)